MICIELVGPASDLAAAMGTVFDVLSYNAVTHIHTNKHLATLVYCV